MVMPSLIGADARLNAVAAGDQAGERTVQLTNGTALVHWQVVGSATPFQGRIVGVNGPASTSDLVFGNIAPGSTVAIADLPSGAFVVVSRLGSSLHVERFSALGVSTNATDLVSSEAITGGPIVETTSDGTIGIYVKTATQAQVGALDANLALTVPFDTLVLNNGSAQSPTDADGSIWTLIDGAGVGARSFGFVSTRGTGAATTIQLHVVSLATETDVSGPITIASGAGVDVASFKLVEMTNGNLLASWIDGTSVRAQIFSQAGARVGAGISVAATVPTGASATGLSDGGVMLVWSDIVGATRDIQGAVFTAAGASSSAVFTINGDSDGAQTNPSAALLSNGEVVIAWDSANGASVDVVDRVASFTRPDAVADSFIVTAGTPTTLALTANDSDPNGNTISVQSVGTASSGTVTLASGVVTYTPAAGYTGPASFTYTLVDSTGLVDTAAVTLNVQASVLTGPLLRVDPGDGTSGVPVVANLALTFAGAVTRGTGTITLSRADGTVVETFDAATSNRVTVSGNRVVVDPSAALSPSSGYTLSVASGALLVGGTAYGGLTGYDFMTTPAAVVADQYVLAATAATMVTASGYGRVVGDTGTQDVTIVNLPGRIVLDASFNAGGDRIHLDGAASDYTIFRNGSAAQLSDGDTTIVVPIGISGADILFSDGVRSLSASPDTGVTRLSAQVLTTTPTQITAAATAATALGTATQQTVAQRAIVAGSTSSIYGNEQVFGTNTAAETVRIARGATAFLDASFNAGGDTIVLPGTAGSYAAVRSGSSLVLTSATENVTIPVGTVGATLRFADGDRTLLFDTATSTVRIGTQAIATTSATLTATLTTAASLDQDGDANLATPFTISAAGGNFRYADNGDVAHNVVLAGFGRGDSLVLQGAADSFYFSGEGTVITISHVGSDGRLSTTVIQGIADPAIAVNSEATAEAAAGFDFVSFTV